LFLHNTVLDWTLLQHLCPPPPKKTPFAGLLLVVWTSLCSSPCGAQTAACTLWEMQAAGGTSTGSHHRTCSRHSYRCVPQIVASVRTSSPAVREHSRWHLWVLPLCSSRLHCSVCAVLHQPMLCRAAPCCTMLYGRYPTTPYHSILYKTMLCCAVLCCRHHHRPRQSCVRMQSLVSRPGCLACTVMKC
jgi:hypothetical protein